MNWQTATRRGRKAEERRIQKLDGIIDFIEWVNPGATAAFVAATQEREQRERDAD